jgi:hypothetical protein
MKQFIFRFSLLKICNIFVFFKHDWSWKGIKTTRIVCITPVWEGILIRTSPIKFARRMTWLDVNIFVFSVNWHHRRCPITWLVGIILLMGDTIMCCPQMQKHSQLFQITPKIIQGQTDDCFILFITHSSINTYTQYICRHNLLDSAWIWLLSLTRTCLSVSTSLFPSTKLF